MESEHTCNNFLSPHGVVEEVKFLKQKVSAKFLYLIYCKLHDRFADKNGYFFRSMENLEQDSGMKKKTIILANKILQDNEYIDIKHTFFKHSKKRTYNSYRLNGFRFRSGVKKVHRENVNGLNKEK